MSDTTLRDQLGAHFAPTDIEWRIGQAGKKDDGTIWAKAFAYITNRAIQERLDEVVGPANWKNKFKAWEVGTPGVMCGLALKIADEWVTKWDGAEQSDMEALKGGLSGAMKRAAVQWGIGRYLYDLPEGWAKVGPQGAHFASGVKVKQKGGGEERVSFKWDPPDLPKWALPDGTTNGNAHHAPTSPASAPPQRAVPEAASAQTPEPANGREGPYAPTEKQVAFFQRLAESPCFTFEERTRALEWLATKATRATIKDQIDWLKGQVEKRRPGVMQDD